MKKILLIDGNSILNRAFYGLPDLTNSKGLHTNAILGFINIMQKVVDEEKASHVCVAFDVKHPTFRHEMYEAYKGTRKPMADELRQQLPVIKDVLHSMNITTIEKAGYEADDILGTLSRKAFAEKFKVVVLSGDRDLLQLATDEILIRIPKTKAGKTTIENYYADDVKALYGVDPVTFIDMKALMGDTSDNIPGVPSIGEKTASKLLIEYGSLDGVYAGLPQMKQSKMKENIENNKDLAYLSKELATIKLDCELDVNLEEATYDNIYNPGSYELFKELEFKSLLKRFDEKDKHSLTNLEYEKILVDDYDLYVDAISNIKKQKEGNEDKNLGVAYVKYMGEYVFASLCPDAEHVYVIPFMNFVTSDMLSDDLKKLSESGIILDFMDIKSCLTALDFLDVTSDLSRVNDCGIGAYLLNPVSLSYTYYDIARVFLDITLKDEKELLGKKEINAFSYADSDVMDYVAYQSLIPYLCWDKIKTELANENMYELYTDIELPCAFSLFTMEKNGVKVDENGLLEYGEKLKNRIDELTTGIYELAGKEFNINSTKQLGEILFEDLGLKSGKKTKTGYSTSVEVLEKIENEHPIIPLILEYRQLTKLNSTYVEGLKNYISSDGRIHGTFNQTVTATGRISSTEPNLQNIPTRYPLGREIRKVFVPEDGYIFLDADYSQVELRVLAHMSADETLIEAYNEGTDIHAITASQVFGVPLDEVDSLMRRRAKAVNFGIVYGISSFGLGQDLDIGRKEAEQYIEKYFSVYKRVKEYLDETVKSAKENGYSLTMFNRKRPIPELASSNFMTRNFGERVAMNSPIQGTAADIMKIAMVNVDKALKEGGYKSRLILQIHDELIIETFKDELDEVKKILVDNMSGAAKLLVPLIVDVNAGENWYEAK